MIGWAWRTYLSKLRVLDLSRLLPGAYCSLLLADLGADVIKVEDSKGGDYMRWIPPLVDEYGAYFHATNRNKKSIKLNLDSPRGKEIVKRLAARSDVLIESFRPGVMQKQGLGYDALAELNPRLVYCSITGYGQSGPYSRKAGHDINYISIAGILAGMRQRDGRPVMPSVQLADVGASYVAALSILAALLEREASGKGNFLDVSITEAALSFMTVHLGKYLFDKEPRGGGMLSGGLACYNVYKTKDGKYLSLGALEVKFWKEFLVIVGREDLIERQFDQQQEEVWSEISRIFETKTRDEWLSLFKGKEVCCEPVYELDEVTTDPQIRARDMIFRLRLANGDEWEQVRTPVKPSDEASQRERAPGYGEHTRDILKEFGYSENEITELAKEGII